MNRSGASARPAAGWDGVSLNQMTPNNQLHRTRKQRRFACCLRAGLGSKLIGIRWSCVVSRVRGRTVASADVSGRLKEAACIR